MDPILLIIDPNTLQSTILAWIGVLTVLLGAISGFIALIIAKYNQLKAVAAAEEAKYKAALAAEKAQAVDARMDRQGAKMETLQQTVTQVALATTPTNGNGKSPLPVEVKNEPLNVKET